MEISRGTDIFNCIAKTLLLETSIALEDQLMFYKSVIAPITELCLSCMTYKSIEN